MSSHFPLFSDLVCISQTVLRHVSHWHGIMYLILCLTSQNRQHEPFFPFFHDISEPLNAAFLLSFICNNNICLPVHIFQILRQHHLLSSEYRPVEQVCKSFFVAQPVLNRNVCFSHRQLLPL